MEETNVKKNSAKAWLLAARPKTCAAAVAPVIVGSAIAARFGMFKPVAALLCLLFAVSMQIAANLINDYFDFMKGSDGEDRLGPLRATAQGWITPSAMKVGVVAVIVLGCLCGLPLVYFGGWEMILVGLFCVLFAYLYTSGPFPLSYNGLGDIAVVLFFGLVAVGFTAYVQMSDWNETIVYCGVATGLVVDTLLVLNNYRDRAQDEKNGKRTSVVLHGEKFGRYLYLLLGVVAIVMVMQYFFVFAYISLPKYVPSVFRDLGSMSVLFKMIAFPVLVCLYLIPHFFTWRKISRIKAGRELNSLIGETARNMLVFALVLSLVLIF